MSISSNAPSRRTGRALTLSAFLLPVFLLLAFGPVQAQSLASIQMLLGNPSAATSDIKNPNNYLIQRPQYALGYNRDKAIPNWVAWHLGPADLGDSGRSDNFLTDTSLPTGWYRAASSDYTGTNWNRGHNCPSGDRTYTDADNQQVFLMTNIMPQSPDNNQGPWEQLESYCRSLVTGSYDELYIYSCNSGSQGTLNNAGHITIPETLYKVVVVIPFLRGNDLARVTANTRVIAVAMPNVQGILNVKWQTYRCSVNTVQNSTGLTFFTNIDPRVAAILRAKIDNQ